MTDRLDGRPPHPARRDGRPARSTSALYDLVEARFRRLIRDNPVLATTSASTPRTTGSATPRDAVLGELADEKAHLAAVEAIDPAGLSRRGRLERDLEIHNLRRTIFDTEVVRTVGAPLDRARHDRRRPVPASSPRTSRRCRAARRDRRPARGDPRVPRGGRRRGRPSPRSGCGSSSRSSRPPTCRRSSTRSSPRAARCRDADGAACERPPKRPGAPSRGYARG